MLTQADELRFCKARRAFIEGQFKSLNPMQRKAVLATEGPLLLLAGAGSGKTTVLIHRIANLMEFGRGSDSDEVPGWVTEEDLDFLEQCAPGVQGEQRERAVRLCRLEPAAPWSILAITFTNKAAGELKERLERRLGPEALDVWAATFHSACVRILRRDIDRLGFERSFTIYDTDDSVRVIKDVLKALNLDDKTFVPRAVLGHISRAKDEMLMAADYAAQQQKTGDFRLQKIGRIYTEYEKRLRDANALDFDDIILHTVRLLLEHEDVRAYYQHKFRYVLIDEYQDTNNLQYRLAAALAGGYENICVVGDDDQSIYRFRGATIENILSFEEQYKGARVIRLEQNYRSTKTILEAANAVIRNNQGRKGKELWTEHGQGDKVEFYTAMNEHDEAQYVAAQMLAGYAAGRKWNEFAILYRMNAQSNQMEQAMKRNGIPYRIIGGTRFFDRAEVKDMLAYLCVINNPHDDLRLKRIINNPPRGIGATTVDRAQAIAIEEELSLWQVISNPKVYPDLQKAAGKLAVFTDMINQLRETVSNMTLPEFYEEVMAKSGYVTMLEAKNDMESRGRLENVQELASSISGYLENAEEPTLAGFLDEVALYTDLDHHDPDEACNVMMTMHSAKGLEFPVVFVVGAEEGIFPGMQAIGDQSEMEEERRLCYVAMTRAKEKLYITCAGQRMLYGRTSNNRPSRFIEEIPADLLNRTGRSFRPVPDDAGGVWKSGRDSEFDQTTCYDEQPRRSSYSGSRGGTSYGGGSSGYGGTSYGGSPYGKPSVRPAAKPAYGSSKPSYSAAKPAADLPAFSKGDMVEHKAFGKGMVLSVQKMGGDALLEIAFDNVGTKRLMLKAAAQHMKKQ